MADWVAMVGLGKLSDVQGDREKSNILWALWAPLLLLHLGGLDTITVYSLEDNQLWIRHLLGLVVQLFIAIYVIMMSWKNSWFSFMSLPALVAGFINYWKRTSVLKWVSNDKYLNRISVDSFRNRISVGYFIDHPEGHEYLRLLLMACGHLLEFIWYLSSGGVGNQVSSLGNYPREANIFWDRVEVQMGLVYELLYTKAAVIYSRRGFIMRCISFGCTVSVLVGLTIKIVLLKAREEDDEENWHEIDIAVTGVLIVGAVALEIYAAVVLFSSNWMMIWLIEQGKKEWVIWLSQRFPRLFNKKKKYWSQMMGQFDLLGYYIKLKEPDVQSPSRSGSNKEGKKSPTRKIIRLVLGHNYEDKWNKYLHTTACSVHPLVYNAIVELCDPHIDSTIFNSLTSELDEVWVILKDRSIMGDDFSKLIMTAHLATEICYRLEMEWDAGGEDDPSRSDALLWKQNRKVSKVLSDYMMYLLILNPSLLPNVASLERLEDELNILESCIGNAHDINAACQNLLMDFEGPHRSWGWRRITTYLKGKDKAKRWEIIKQMWLRTICDATRSEKGFGRKNSHFQQLKEGGELLTLIWFSNPPYINFNPW